MLVDSKTSSACGKIDEDANCSEDDKSSIANQRKHADMSTDADTCSDANSADAVEKEIESLNGSDAETSSLEAKDQTKILKISLETPNDEKVSDKTYQANNAKGKRYQKEEEHDNIVHKHVSEKDYSENNVESKDLAIETVELRSCDKEIENTDELPQIVSVHSEAVDPGMYKVIGV